MSGLPDNPTPEQTEEWIKRVSNDGAETVGKLVAFGRAIHKLKLGASGGRVTLNSEDCNAIIWGIQLFRERGSD